MNPSSTITHRGMTVEISDDLTFRIASLLWEDLVKEWAVNGNIPKDAPITFTREILNPVNCSCVYPLSIPAVNLPEEKQPAPEKKVAVPNKWQIPFSYKTERKEYDRAWGLCRKYNLPYPEALKKKDDGVTPEGFVEKTEKPKPKIGGVNKWDIPFSSKDESRKYDVAWKLCKKYGLKYPEALKLKEAGIKPGEKTPEVKVERPLHKQISDASKANKTQLGGIVLPDELKPLEEKKSFFVGAQVKQVAGRSPHAMGAGDIIEIKGNGDIVVEFYHERKTLKRDELAFYSPPNQNSVMKVRT